MITDYYKYYEDVPRIFMEKISSIAHNYYDKKRRINYIKIKKELEGSQFKEKIKIHETDSSITEVS